MEHHRRTALRIGDVRVTYRGLDNGVPQNALHFCQVHSCFQQIGSAAMAELMKTVYRNLRTSGDRVNPVTDRHAR